MYNEGGRATLHVERLAYQSGKLAEANCLHPLIPRHIDLPPERITILSGDPRGQQVAAEYGVGFAVRPLTRDNFRDVLTPLLGAGDLLLNLG